MQPWLVWPCNVDQHGFEHTVIQSFIFCLSNAGVTGVVFLIPLIPLHLGTSLCLGSECAMATPYTEHAASSCSSNESYLKYFNSDSTSCVPPTAVFFLYIEMLFSSSDLMIWLWKIHVQFVPTVTPQHASVSLLHLQIILCQDCESCCFSF